MGQTARRIDGQYRKTATGAGSLSQPNADEAVTRSHRASFDRELVDGQIQLAANTANLPVFTIIRLWTLDRLHAERTGGTVTDRLARLEHAVFRRSA